MTESQFTLHRLRPAIFAPGQLGRTRVLFASSRWGGDLFGHWLWLLLCPLTAEVKGTLLEHTNTQALENSPMCNFYFSPICLSEWHAVRASLYSSVNYLSLTDNVMSGKTIKESLKEIFFSLAFTYNIPVPTGLAHKIAKCLPKLEGYLMRVS